MRGLPGSVVLTVAFAMAAMDCLYPATAVQVVIDTDAPADRALTIHATIERRSNPGTDGGDRTWSTSDNGGLRLPASFTIVPRDDEPRDDEVLLTLDAMLAGDGSHPAVMFRRRAQFRFTPRVTTAIRVFLPTACGDASSDCTRVPLSECTVSVRCEELQMTCGDRGECVASGIEPVPIPDGGIVLQPRDVQYIDNARADDGAPIDATPEMAVDVPAPIDVPVVVDVPIDMPPVDTGACASGAMRGCYTGPVGTAGQGLCVAGTQVCTAGVWGTCAGEVRPRPEVCWNTVDEDCDGRNDTGCPVQRSCSGTAPPGCGIVGVQGGGAFVLGQIGAQNGEPVQSMIRVTTAFGIDAYEVTLARFRRYWDAGHPAPASPVPYPGVMLPWAGAIVEPIVIGAMACNWTATAGTREAHPLNCIDWYTAQAFCVWDGGRLPTEAEYEWTARYRPVAGVAPGRTYPWGEAIPVGSSTVPCDHAQFNLCTGDDGRTTRHVGSFAASGGVYDLVGNVSEWEADSWQVYTGTCWNDVARDNPLCRTTEASDRARRSGSAGSPSTTRIRIATRDFYAVSAREDQLGFRCVR